MINITATHNITCISKKVCFIKFVLILSAVFYILIFPNKVEAVVISSSQTLEADQTINEDVVFNGGILDLNGHNLNINGNFLQSDGILKLNGGCLNVEGDYRIQSKTVADDGTVTYGPCWGVLQMYNDSDYVKINGSFISNSGRSTDNSNTSPGVFNCFKAGTLEVKGDFTQLYCSATGWSSSYSNFDAIGTHKVILSGTGLQTISFDTPREYINTNSGSQFNILEVTNNSEEGIKTNTPITINKIDSDLSIPVNNKEDFLLYSIDLNRHSLTIKGNLIQPNGVITLNGGCLNVEGDYRIQSKTVADDGTVTYGPCWGVLQMYNDSDYVKINGSFISNSGRSTDNSNTSPGVFNCFKAGTLEVKGDFTQLYCSATGWSSSYSNFDAIGTHKVILSGTGLQTVSFDTPREYINTNSGSQFNILEVTNNSEEGIKTNTPITINKIDSDLSIPVNNKEDFLLYSIDLNGHSLTIKGNLIQPNGVITLNGGCLNVEGDYRIQTKTVADDGTVTYGPCWGVLQMYNDSDYVKINGSFISNSGRSTDNSNTSPGVFNCFKAGTLEVKGDFTQLYCSATGWSSSYSNFDATGTHKVILSGTGLQTISFDTPREYINTNSGSQFNILEVTNSSIEGIKTNTPITVNKIDSDLSIPVNNKEDFLLYSIDLNGHSLTIKGNLIQPNGVITLNGGCLNVEGDYRIQAKTVADDGTVTYGPCLGVLQMYNDNDYVKINGSFISNSGRSTDNSNTSPGVFNCFKAGTLEVKGDFTQLYCSATGWSSSYSNFDATGTHKVILSGTGQQIISFDTPSTFNVDTYGRISSVSKNSQFNILEIRNSNYRFISSFPNPWYFNTLIDKTIATNTGTGNLEQVSTRDYIDQEYTYGSYWGDPIDTATGAHVIKNILLTEAGIQPLDFEVSYNSLLLNEDTIGNGWGHNFEAYLEVMANNNVVIHWTANRKNNFIKNGSSYSSSDLSTRFDTLIKNDDGTYILKKGQTSYLFNANGKLTQIQNNKGQVLNLIYDSSGLLININEPVSGQNLNLSYNTSGFIDKVSDNLNRQVCFNYDDDHNLVSITDALGLATSYTYNSDKRILSATDSQGIKLFTNTYDGQGRVVSQDDGLSSNKLTMFSYDEFSDQGKIITTVTDRNSNKRIYTHDNQYQLLSLTDQMGNTISYNYNAYGMQTSVIDALGLSTYYSYDTHSNPLTITDANQQTTKMTYDSQDNLLSIENSLGKKITFTYDDKNNLLSSTDLLGNISGYTYDNNGQLLTQTKTGNTTTYTYENGQLKTITDPEGIETQYKYDQAGRIVKVTDGEGKTIITEYDKNNNILSETDPLENRVNYVYGIHNQLLSRTDSKGTTIYEYDGNYNLTSSIDALGNQTQYVYDGEDRLTKTTDPRGNTTTFSYDSKGRLIGVKDALGNTTSYEYDAADRQISITDAKGNKIIKEYDNTNNLLSVTNQQGNKVSYMYDVLNRVILLTDAMNNETQYTYDDLGNLVSAIDPAGVQSQQTFDGQGNISSIVDPAGNTTSFKYDKDNRLIEIADSQGNADTRQYNARSKIKSITNARGQTTEYQYDDAGRLVTRTDKSGSVTYTYDPNNNLVTITDNKGTISREYDALNRVTEYTDARGNVIGYQYDEVGNLKALTYPDGKKVNYEYNSLNNLTKVSDWENRVTSYEYDVNSNLIKTTRPDGSILTITYDNTGQILQQKDVDKNAKIISQYDFTYDQAGNVLSENTTLSTFSQEEKNITMAYGSGNRMTGINDQQLNYDADGNMLIGPLKGTSANFTYDSHNRLITAGDCTYTYDAEDNRISVSDAVYQTEYVINSQAVLNQVLTKNQGVNHTYYVYGLGLIGEETAGNYSTYHYDRRGSTIVLTGMDGTVTDTYDYGPFGELLGQNGNITTQFLYNGRDGVMTDSNGLYYMRARYYNPDIKRFLSQDILLGSIRQGQSMNRYAYLGNRPINMVDPFGLWQTDDTTPYEDKPFDQQLNDFKNLMREASDPNTYNSLRELDPALGNTLQDIGTTGVEAYKNEIRIGQSAAKSLTTYDMSPFYDETAYQIAGDTGVKIREGYKTYKKINKFIKDPNGALQNYIMSTVKKTIIDKMRQSNDPKGALETYIMDTYKKYELNQRRNDQHGS